MKTIFKKVIRITGLALGSLLAIVVVAYLTIVFRVNRRMNKQYDVAAERIVVNYDSASIASGERLVSVRACRECHGKDLGGNILVDDFMIGRFVVKNITTGKGGLSESFDVDDWVLAMKHGLNRDMTPLRLMPSHELSQMSEGDIADIIAYCSNLPAVDRELPSFKVGPLGYVLTELGLIPLLPAEQTDHAKPFASEIKPEVSAAYGKYLSTICINCHGQNYKGSKSPIPGGKDRPDITGAGHPGKWTEQQFIHALRTGETPEGKKMLAEDMPWTITKNYNDTELKAIHLFLKSL